MTKKLSIFITARGYELDSYNHVNNAVYLNYFEHARWEFFRKLGLYDFMKQQGLLPVVTEIQIRYQHEITLFSNLEVVSWCTEEKPYLVFRQRILHSDNGLVAARANTKLIFLDSEKTPVNVPTIILEAI
jgi:acyl-CoA thioester hydrolase